MRIHSNTYCKTLNEYYAIIKVPIPIQRPHFYLQLLGKRPKFVRNKGKKESENLGSEKKSENLESEIFVINVCDSQVMEKGVTSYQWDGSDIVFQEGKKRIH